MTSAIAKKPCVKCSKGGGIFTCDGCQQSFCRKHSDEHRHELATEIDQIGQEHDLFQRDLTRETGTHPLMIRIDQWERESITKIQVAAEAARADLRELIDRTKNELKKSINKMTDELQSSQQSDDYTEMDLTRWVEQLKEFRQVLENPSSINIAIDKNVSSAIHLIKVSGHSQTRSSARTVSTTKRNAHASEGSISVAHERFDEADKNIQLTEQGLVATCLVYTRAHQSAYGVNRYSSGTHHIRFRIEKKTPNYYLFLGIITSSEKLDIREMSTPSVYGWRDLDYIFKDGRKQNASSEKVLSIGDEMTLTVDCDNRELRFEHHRTNRLDQLSVNLEACPFPWKFIVVMYAKSDCVRILH